MSKPSLQDYPEKFILDRPDQLRALGATATHDAFIGLLNIGEGGVADIAKAIGKSPHSLYHHMEKLVNVGLVLPAGERRSGARTEQIYRPVAHLLYTDPDNNDPDYLAAIAENARANFRRAGKAATYALAQGLANRQADQTNLLSLQFSVPLPPEQVQQLVARLNNVVDEFTSAQAAQDGAPHYLVTLGLSPLKTE